MIEESLLTPTACHISTALDVQDGTATLSWRQDARPVVSRAIAFGSPTGRLLLLYLNWPIG
jgi:hypothetical protein